MFLKYGNYSHSANDAVVTITAQSLRAQSGVQYGIEETWSIRGMLQGDDATALTTAINQMTNAYAVDYKGLGIFNDDNTPTAHVRTGLNSLGGVTIEQPPHWPEGGGAEYSTFRTYQIVAKCRYPVPFGGNPLLSWQETLTFTGTGGARFVYLQPLVGLPQKQQVAQSTPVQVTQAGSATALIDYPLPAACLSPADEHLERRRIEYKTPRRLGNSPKYLEFEVSWSYEMELAVPASLVPTLWQ